MSKNSFVCNLFLIKHSLEFPYRNKVINYVCIIQTSKKNVSLICRLEKSGIKSFRKFLFRWKALILFAFTYHFCNVWFCTALKLNSIEKLADVENKILLPLFYFSFFFQTPQTLLLQRWKIWMFLLMQIESFIMHTQ